MNISRINVVQDSYQDIDIASINNYILQNYVFPVSNLQCTKESFDDFIQGLQSQEEITINEFDISQTNKTTYIEEINKKFIIICQLLGSENMYNITIFGNTIEESSKMYKLFKEYEHYDESTYILLKTTNTSGGNLSESFKRLKLSDFDTDINDFYPYLDVDEMFKQFTESNESILVLFGNPGVGKTRLANLYMKWMIKNVQCCIDNNLIDNECVLDEEVIINVSYVKNEDILSLDQYWNNLSNNIHGLVFLDDADFCLTSRKNESLTTEDHNKNKFLSQLLSYTDGITKNNTKFIITTNIGIDDIDTAVLRKGRTFDILNLRYLNENEAKEIWTSQGLDIERYHNYLDGDKIPACDLGSAINTENNRSKSGKELKNYLREENISILNNSKNKKNVGFF